MNTYIIQGIPMIHISSFAYALNRSVTSTRRLVEKGNNIRKLKAFRDRSRIMIPLAELEGFPFLESGPNNKRNIYHYVPIKAEGAKDAYTYKKVLCEKCTYGDGCEKRKEAEELICPKGDD